MNQWPFVIAVYAIGIVGTLAIVAWAYAGLKRTENRLEQVRRK